MLTNVNQCSKKEIVFKCNGNHFYIFTYGTNKKSLKRLLLCYFFVWKKIFVMTKLYAWVLFILLFYLNSDRRIAAIVLHTTLQTQLIWQKKKHSKKDKIFLSTKLMAFVTYLMMFLSTFVQPVFSFFNRLYIAKNSILID